ncbi:MAG: PEGA domain-containing protein [Anaeromyxobacter sp.]
MRSVNPAPRFHILAPLPPIEGWERSLALDRQGGVPRPVVLSFAPAALAEDAARLAALSRDAEAAARASDPHLVQVLGLEPVGERLALVERHRPGTSLRALLDEAGRLPPDLAVRAVVDACAGLQALHALVPDGEPVAHGGISAERLVVGEDGATRVSGLGVHGGREPRADLRALAAVLHEALSGEPPGTPPATLEVPGVPPALAAVVDLALGAAPGGPFPTAASLAEAIAAALPPAAGGALAAYAEAVGPPREGAAPVAPAPEAVPEVSAELIAPAAPQLPEVSAELIAPAPPRPAPAPPPPAMAPPAAAAPRPPAPVPEFDPGPMARAAEALDAARTFPAPPRQQPRSPAPWIAAAVMFAVGVAFPVVLDRLHRPPAPAAAAPAPAAPPVTEAPAHPAPERPAAPPATAAKPAKAEPAAPVRASAPAAPRAAPEPSLAVTTVPAVEVAVGGKKYGRAPVTVALPRGDHELRLTDAAEGIDVRRTVKVRGPATPVRIELGRGWLDVTAPADAEVRLDGRVVGKGNVKVQLWEGRHRVEVRLGQAKVQERFEVAPNETWTYNVTPTP